MKASGGRIRGLRYALARGLGADPSDRARLVEAVAQLDRALTEDGNEPSDVELQLAAGKLLENIDPSRALERYIAALDRATMDESVARARELLKRSELDSSVASLPTEAVDKVKRVALDTLAPGPTLLASSLLREQGRDLEAIDMLQRACDADRSVTIELRSELADTLLDVDRSEEVLALIGGEGHRDDALQLAYAQASLAQGDLAAALGAVDPLLHDVSAAAPAALAVRALSLLGTAGVDEALESLSADVAEAPEVNLARAIVHLQRRDYDAAREASWALLRMRPIDPDALLINAQTVVESLGSDTDSTASAGSELDAARRLLPEAVAGIPAFPPRSRWWRSQWAVRHQDGPYRAFACELRFAMGARLEVDELLDVDRTSTSWLHDAGLKELQARVSERSGDRAAAASAYDEAAQLFGDSVSDPLRAAECARLAYERAPTPQRGADFAARALSASFDTGLEPEAALEVTETGRKAAEHALAAGDQEQMSRLVHGIAWLRVRETELSPRPARERKSDVLPWILAAFAVRPDDSVLRAVIASELSDLDYRAGALLWAQAAYDAAPAESYVVETAVVAVANYYADLDRVQPLLAEHAAMAGEEVSWRNAVELAICQAAGDRDGAGARLDSIPATPWAQRERATAKALLDGIPAATADLVTALEAVTSDTNASPIGALFLSLLLRRREEAASHHDAAAEDPAVRPVDLEAARLMLRFAFEAAMPPGDFIVEGLPLCESPNEVGEFVNVTLPLLMAARSGRAGPVPRVPVDQALIDARLRELEHGLPRWAEQLERETPLLGALAILADGSAGVSALTTAARRAAEACSDMLLESTLGYVGELVVARAGANMPAAMMGALLDPRREANPADVRLVVDGLVDLPLDNRLLVALLARPTEPGNVARLANEASHDEIMQASEELLRAARSVVHDTESWWRVDDALAKSISELDHVPAASVAALAAGWPDLLGELVGFNATEETLQQRNSFAFAMGTDLIPEDTGPDSVLFSELLPAVRERVQADTGFDLPACTVMADRLYRDTLRLLINDVPLESVRLPTTGWLTPAGENAGGSADPLTGMPVGAHDGVDRPPGAWTPLEFLMRHVEHFARTHLARFVSILDANENASLLGQDVLRRVASDPRTLLQWLHLLREAATLGEMHDRLAVAHRIAGQMLDPQPAALAGEAADVVSANSERADVRA